MTRQYTGNEIAVVGMAGRFPGAENVDELWRNLRDGVESIRLLSPEELAARGVDSAVTSDPSWVAAVSEMAGYADFDAGFFGINHREAEVMDPQQRVFLECAWEALEDAGCDPQRYGGSIAVYAGATLSTYLLLNLSRNQRLVSSSDPLQLIVGNTGDTLVTRVSYKLDLQGPSHTVQSACSTSLVAVHLGCQSLLNEECDMALAGGVSINVGQGAGYRHQPDSILSPDGHCRPFDARAAGTVFGSGVGAVVLKRLEEALGEGDPIRAVILGSAVNNDGALKVGFTAPSVEGQARVISEALAVAGVEAETISYLEAHGTGTALGDPVEVQALTRAWRSSTDRTGFCALGSVKGNFGHLDTAAGVAGLIKTVLALEHRQIPPSINFEAPNPKIDFASAPVRVNAELTEWTAEPRRAGVDSFGLGGTNAHVVLEEAPEIEVAGDPRPWQLLVVSAKSEAALEAATRNLAEHLRQHPDLHPEDVAYTLHLGRRAFGERSMVTCRDVEDAITCLETRDPRRLLSASGVPEEGGPQVAFMFPGQGAQYAGMGRELYACEPVFRTEIDRCAERLTSHLGRDLRRILYPQPDEQDEAERLLADTRFAQPALFAVEYALAQLWLHWGVRPRAMIGHSLGEYVAACVAGVYSLEEGLELIAERGRLVAATAAGAMLSVPLNEEEIAPLVGDELALAAVNAPGVSTVAGADAAVAALAETLAARGVECRRLRVSVAMHSPLMDPVVEPLRAAVARMDRKPPRIPWVSNLTGTWIGDEEAIGPAYWGRHLRHPVRFADGVGALLAATGGPLLEVGPGRTLRTLVSRHPAAAGRLVLASTRHPKEPGSDVAFLLDRLGQLWLAGVGIDWDRFYEGRRRRRVSLPPYPFQRRRYWVEPDGAAGMAAPAGATRVPEAAATDAQVYARPKLRTDFVAPGNDVERQVARIWQELLGVEQVGRDDNFYELDGHSLLATQVASRLQERYRVEVPVRELLAQPTVAGMAGAVAEALAERPPAAAAGAEKRAPAIAPRPRGMNRVSLSFAQDRMWFLDRLDPGTNAYNLGFPLRIRGPLEVATVRACFHAIGRRHELLRTTYGMDEGQPVQIIDEQTRLEPGLIDLAALDPGRRESEARRLAAREHQRPFDLERGPIFRALFLRLGAEDHVLVVVTHHIASDAWSMGVLMGEFKALYEAFSQGPLIPPSPLRPLLIQYADYALWQRQYLQGEVLDSHLGYWRQQLADLPGPLRLPADRPRRDPQGFRPGGSAVMLPPPLVAALKELGSRHGATLYMTLVAAYVALLYRYTGETDVLIGAPIANRTRAEIEGLIGYFLNTLVLRTRFRPGARFRELLAEVSDTAFAGYAHQDLPMELLPKAVDGDRASGLTSLFQVMFLLENVPLPELNVAELTGELLTVGTAPPELGTNVFELSLTMEERDHGMIAAVAYNGALFDQTTMTRFLGHLRSLLVAVAADGQQRVEALPLLGAAERRWLLEINDTADERLRPASCVHSLVAAQAARDPGAVAVVSEQGELSYGELDRRANQLARYLVRQGVGPEVAVGLCLERRPEMVIAILGVLKAGGAWVPLDPVYPEERKRLILADARVAAVVTSEALAATLTGAATFDPPSIPPYDKGGRPRPSPATVVCLDRQWEEIAGQPAADPATAVTPDHPAYVIYTSGSTGRPKGVVITHRALAGFTTAARHAYPIAARDRVLQFASLSFDASAEEIFPALTSGAAVVLRTDAMLASPAALRDQCRHWGVTVLDLPTAYWHELTAGLARADLELGPPLRLVILGGERPRPEQLATFLEHLDPGVRLLNTYGPTEATVVATYAAVPRAVPDGEVPIGRPLANVRAYVLDRRLELAPIGVGGELHLAGAGLARGYLGRPALTAAGFVPDPFSPEPGRRLYRTGDRVRRLASGGLEFLGRIDFQVKIRGFRVELGEIEATLREHPAVGEAAVLVQGGGAREHSLVAYAATGGGELDADQLRDFLRPRLPEYMVPATFVVLDRLPLGPAGKVDRQALPVADSREPEEDHGYVPPSTEAEEVLGEIFAQALGRERVGIHDGFFDLGGHSLLLPEVLYRVGEAFQVEVPLRALYDEPTVAGLAEIVEELILDQIEGWEE